jgi:uncharacterized protein YajQ (UPF0234 family)
MIDYAAAGDLLEAYGRAWETFDGDAWVAIFDDEAEYHEDPFGAPLVGHNALRAYLLDASASQRDVEFTVERHWVSGDTILAAWHATVHPAGLGPVRADGRVHQPRSPRTAGSRAFANGRGTGQRAEARRGGSMAGDQSFDVVSDFDEQELRNALDQVRREAGTRFDFKGVTVDLTQAKEELILITNDEGRANALKDLIESKAIRRGLSLKIFDWGKIEEAGGNKVRQRIGLRRGLSDEIARKITRLIRTNIRKSSRRSRVTRCAYPARAATISSGDRAPARAR